MEAEIINGRKIREEILEEVRKGVMELPFQPVFCDVLVGNDPVSLQYVNMKAKFARDVGMKFHSANFSKGISIEELCNEIRKLKHVPNMCGIIVQLPLPLNLNERKQEVLDSVDQALDVDCLSSDSSNKFYEGKNDIAFPTALACMAILDSIEVSLENKKIVVLGQGELVGKPITALLNFRGFSPLTVRSKTHNKESILKEADVIISGIGKGKFITGDMIKKGAIIIDAGTSESGGGIVGDVDTSSVKGIASFVSLVPGGVGPVTVGMLLWNVLKVAQKKDRNE